MGRLRRTAPFLVIALILALPALEASGALSPLNDLLALGSAGGQKPERVATVRRAEPPLLATPRAQCGPGSKPEPGIQGRVPAGAATDGLHCNVSLVAHQGTSGGFKVLRYVDPAGHECAFYDTALLYPVNALKLDTSSVGVAVLDMSDPAHPVQTATLTELPMMSPHESLNLNPARGLLAAVLGNPSTYPGLVSIYDVRKDCRQPVLQSTRPVARLGHESGFSPDGKTFYATGTAVEAITAVDVTDPKQPHAVWQGNVTSHGMSLSADGKRAYIADPGGELLVLDVSEIQARKADPQAREVSRLTWQAASIPQNALPFRRDGKPYLLEIDEYTQGTTGGGDANQVGAARIIDISDERAPRVVSNLRLQVNQAKDHAEAGADPGAGSPVQGYAAHYCNLSSQVDPTVAACSFISSGLRVFDISDVLHPKEIAYYVAPTEPRAENEFMASDFAMSQPAIVPARREVWYTDGATGFNVVRVAAGVWPAAAGGGAGTSPSARRDCVSRTAPVGRRGIGRIRLGMTRKALARRLPAPRRKTKRAWRWCVKGGKGMVAAAFSRSGRVALVTRAPAGTTRAHLRRRYPHRQKLGRSLVRAGTGSGRIFGVRGGRVRYVAVAAPRTLARAALLRGYLRAAGVRPRH
jgi:LVIVD repeat